MTKKDGHTNSNEFCAECDAAYHTYSCMFQGTGAMSNIKREELEEQITIKIAGHLRNYTNIERDSITYADDLMQLIDQYTQGKVDEAVESFVNEFQTVAIAETNQYANGWNRCRKWVRANLNRLAGLEYSESYSKMPYEEETKPEAQLADIKAKK